jgi:hypothetical protein
MLSLTTLKMSSVHWDEISVLIFTAKELEMLIHQLFWHASPVVANQFDHLYGPRNITSSLARATFQLN